MKLFLLFLCARQGALVWRCKSATNPTGGIVSHNGKGVHREEESEGSRRQSAGLTNRNRMRQPRWMRGQIDSKSDTCTENVEVDAAGISVKASAHYPGRSVDLPKGYHRREAERRVNRSQQRPY